MSDIIVPESRVFRIGRECYVVYLGKEQDDIRPFLRLGNTRRLDDEILNAISTTIITDDHVGNPLLEIHYVPRVKGRYLGDTTVVGTIRRFFKSFDLPTEEVTDYRKIRDGERRHMVWFYSSGNIHLRYDENVIFDLEKREREDRHFVRLYDEAKTEFLRNPLRYLKSDFKGPGVFIDDGNVYWFEGGELLSLESHPGFVAALMTHGIDPDFTTAMNVELDLDDLESRDAAVYVGFVKRVRQRRKQLRILTSRTDFQKKFKLLFPARGQAPATIELAELSTQRKVAFRESIVSRPQVDGVVIHHSGLPELAVGQAGPDVPLRLDVAGSALDIQIGELVKRQILQPGFPVTFHGYLPSESSLLDKYLTYLLPFLKNHMGLEESQRLAGVERYLRLLHEDMMAGKASVSPLHKQTFGQFKDALKKNRSQERGPTWFYYANAVQIASQMASTMNEEHPLRKTAEASVQILKDYLAELGDPEPAWPFWGDLYLEGDAPLLWRSTKRTMSKADVESARAVSERIRSIATLDEGLWDDERERLLKLIRSLSGGQGPLSAEQLSLLETRPEASRPQPKASSPTTRGHIAPKETGAEIPDSSEVSQSSDSSPRKKSGKRKDSRPGLWILLIVLLLFIGLGAVLWHRNGNAPWQRFSTPGGDRTIIVESDAPDEGRTPSDPDRVDSPTGGGDVPQRNEPDDQTSSVVESNGDSESSVEDEPGDVEAPGVDTDQDTVTDEDTEGDGNGVESDPDNGTAVENQNAGGDDETGDEGLVDSVEADLQRSDDEASDSDSSIGIPEVEPINPDVAPRTIQEVRAYLDVEGRVVISEADIHLAANGIAVLNGYKDLDYRVFTGNDPDWIWPGNVLQLPDGGTHRVEAGDTIWFLAARRVRLEVEAQLRVLDAAVARFDSPDLGDEERRRLITDIEAIARDSAASAMRVLAMQTLENRGF